MAPAIQQFKNLFATDSPRIKTSLVRKIAGRRGARSDRGRCVTRSSDGAALFCAPLARLITPPSPLLPALLPFVEALLAQSLTLRGDKRGKNLPNKLSSLISTTLYTKTLYYTNPVGVSTSLSPSLLLTPSPRSLKAQGQGKLSSTRAICVSR